MEADETLNCLILPQQEIAPYQVLHFSESLPSTSLSPTVSFTSPFLSSLLALFHSSLRPEPSQTARLLNLSTSSGSCLWLREDSVVWAALDAGVDLYIAFKIAAVNRIGLGPWSARIEFSFFRGRDSDRSE
ncbi:unnamed protein product [Protopolystoma xenopodis]|uniref:Uncharacterized protein n=1 Tax=Protopolystoma xenopodis TaxID=117903 RepID=A0A3S5A9N3_9PLAT|nr:unnamed protein product [Protopolystoma xenopodis]